MMNYTKKGRVSLFILILSVITLISCGKDKSIIESNEDDQFSEITFSVNDIATRVNGTQFEVSDAVNIEAYATSGELYAKELYIYDSSAIFTSSNPFSVDGQTALSYTALYPANATSESFFNDFTFNIETNQSTHASYEQSDMLVAKVASTSLLKPELSFYHTMSIITVSVVGVTSISDISAELYAQSTVECNIEEGSYQGSGSTNTISPYITSSGFEALVAPQQLSSGVISIMTIGEHEYTWESSMSSTLLSGYKYSYIWSIDEQSGESTVIFDGMINDWADGEWIHGDVVSGEEGEESETGSDTSDDDGIVMNSDTFGKIGEGLSGEFTIEGVTFEYAGITVFEDGDVEYVEIDESGYILNTSLLSNLSKVIVDAYDDSIDGLVVWGRTIDTEKFEYNFTTSSQESPFSYAIPHSCVYIKLSASDESGGFKFKQIEFKQEYEDEVQQ